MNEIQLAEKVAAMIGGAGTSKKTIVGLMIVALVIGAILGAWGMHTFDERDRLALAVEKNKPPVVKETVRTVTQTDVKYIPGETIYISDPVTGKAEPNKLDGKFEVGKPEFVYSLNGKPGKFIKTDDEKYIFDKNMVSLQQSSLVKIEAEIPTIDRTKHGYIGVGINNKFEPAVTAGIKSIWFYGDSDTKAGGLNHRF